MLENKWVKHSRLSGLRQNKDYDNGEVVTETTGRGEKRC